MEENFNKNEYLTTNEGVPIENDTSSLTIGEDGPVVLEDINLVDKLAHFDRERIPERVVHAKGAGARGYFNLTKSMKKYTKAKIFNNENIETPVFVRFSTVVGAKGSPDTARDPRGFAIKFYTEDGNYDIAGNNLPVFFIRDAMKFPDMVHAFKPSPKDNSNDLNRFWDFIANSPESTNMITWIFSDKGTIKSFRKTPGFGVHTFVWVNENGERVYVKYHWHPTEGEETITRQEAEMLAGKDPNVAINDLYSALSQHKNVEYDFSVQIMDINESKNLPFNPLDPTKIWPEDMFPLIKIGKLVLTDAPDNFFEESEQVAFSPANLVPGIEPSNDKLLQGRLFAYHDTQRHRLGVNFYQLPINRPKVNANNNQRDGAMAYNSHEGIVNYSPNTINNGNPKAHHDNSEKTVNFVKGNLDRQIISKANDFTQAGEQYRSYNTTEQEHLIGNIVNDLIHVNKDIRVKAIENFSKADIDFGRRVEDALKAM